MKKVYFTVYYVDKEKNDIKYIREYEEKDQLISDFNLKYKYSYNNYIIKDIENVDLSSCPKMNDNYIIVKDIEIV